VAVRHLRQMELDPEQVRTTVRFLEAYANTALDELESVLAEQIDRTGAERSVVLVNDPAFSIAADAATALREAGQWMLYLNPGRARSLLARSGRLFHEMRQSFGTYLVVVSGEGEDERLSQTVSRALDDLGRLGDGSELEWPPLRHPQQQAYLVLAAAGERSDHALDNQLPVIIERSMHRNGVVPVGALGTPIRRFWDIASHLAGGSVGAAAAISAHLAVMCRRYEECMGLAQVNRRLWGSGASPVDVGDIDIAGIAALAARRFGGEALLHGLREAGVSAEENPIGIAPVDAGLAMAEPWRDESVGDQ
jgi:hypothetical protein